MGSVSCVCWLPVYMRQTITLVALTAGAMDSALAGDVDAPLFGPYAVGDAEFEQVKTQYAVYVPPPPWSAIFLAENLLHSMRGTK